MLLNKHSRYSYQRCHGDGAYGCDPVSLALQSVCKGYAAHEGIEDVNARKNIGGSVVGIKSCDKSCEDVISRKDRGAKSKTVREHEAYDDKERHADHKAPAHREEFVLILNEQITYREEDEREPKKIRNDKYLNERDQIVERDINVCNVNLSCFNQKEKNKINRKI